MSLQLKIAGKTDTGLVRTANEDSMHLDEVNRVFAICDGMGGHQAGEVASMMAVDVLDIIHNHFRTEIQQDKALRLDQAVPESGDVLLKSIRLANRAIFNKAIAQPTLLGMGTTIVAVAVEGDRLSVAHVGDSRAYRIGERELEPLTVDHSWVAEIQQNQDITQEEAASVVGKNVITRALGVRDTVEVDYSAVKVKPGDKFMLCSDGLCGFADDDDIFSVIYRVRDNNERIVENLVQMANDRGGADNVTVAVVEVVQASPTEAEAIERFTLPPEEPDTLAAEDRWLEKIADFAAHSPEKKNPRPAAAAPIKKSTLIIIFAVFILVVAVFLYIASR